MAGHNKGKRLSHVDSEGRGRMVDVSGKAMVDRYAEAKGKVTMSQGCWEKVRDNNIKKGDVLGVAELAGTMAAKHTAALIPFCHSLRLDNIKVTCRLVKNAVEITAQVCCRERTGVEMEALTAVSVAALTIFDMCKAVDPGMEIGPVWVTNKQKDGQVTFERDGSDGTD